MGLAFKMAFFRIKKIKGKEYAYIVKNEWSGKGSRQKVKGYLGRVYRFNLLNGIDFPEHLEIRNIQSYIENSEKNKIINDLIQWELFRFGVDKKDFSIDLKQGIIQKNKKNVALFINDGFMCNITVKNLLEFKPSDEETDGYRLARAFVEAGIKVPQDIFVGLFGKLYKKYN